MDSSGRAGGVALPLSAQGQLCSKSRPPPRNAGAQGRRSGPPPVIPAGIRPALASPSPWAAECYRGQGRVSGKAVVPLPCPGLSERRHEEEDSESKDAGVAGLRQTRGQRRPYRPPAAQGTIMPGVWTCPGEVGLSYAAVRCPPCREHSQVVPTELGSFPLLAPNNFLLVKWDEEAQSRVVVRDPIPRSTPEQPRQGDPSPLSPDQHFSLNVHGPLGGSPQKAA